MSFYSKKYKIKDKDIFLESFMINTFFKDCKKIVDIGCSIGNFVTLDKKRIEGIDIDEDALKIAKKRGLKVRKYNGKKLPYKTNSVDGVFCSQVIEHIEKPLEFMKEIKRILKKDGKLAIITVDYILSHDKYDGFWADYTHKKPFIPKSLKMLMVDAGFKVENIYWIPKPLTLLKIDFINKLIGIEKMKKILISIQKIVPFYKGRDIVVECIYK